MTPYTYECPDHGEFTLEFPFGEAHRAALCVDCPQGLGLHAPRSFASTSFQFTYGKDNFHGQTIKERQERQIAECAADGRQIEPIGSRWV